MRDNRRIEEGRGFERVFPGKKRTEEKFTSGGDLCPLRQMGANEREAALPHGVDIHVPRGKVFFNARQFDAAFSLAQAQAALDDIADALRISWDEGPDEDARGIGP